MSTNAVIGRDVAAVIDDLLDRPLGKAQLRQTMGRSVHPFAWRGGALFAMRRLYT